MKMSEEEKRVRLMAKAEEAIDEYMEWEKENPRPDMTEIEEIALILRKAIGQEIAQMAVEDQEERSPVPGPKCPQCGEEMRYKGEKKVEVESRAGAIKVERGYYHCPGCKEGLFPPG
jgi:hypothetical protein